MARILVVDDEEDVLISIRDVLTRLHHDVVLVGDGEAALSAIDENVPDIVIIDIVMPVMHGLELCERIRESYPPEQVIILVLSARGRPEDIQRALDLGVDGYLVKPFGILSLPGQVSDLLSKRGVT